MFERLRPSQELSNMSNKNAMDFYNGRYLVINVNMFKFTGLYQNKIVKSIIRAIFTMMIIIPSIPRAISAYVNPDNAKLLIQGKGTFVHFISMDVKYFSMLITEEKLKFLYKNMVENWKILENRAERNILKKSWETGRLLTMNYLAHMIGAVQLFVSLPLLPDTINVIYPLFNDSNRMLVLDGEYLVDKQEYYHYIHLFETFTCLMTLRMFSTIESTSPVCVQQCVSLLQVVNLRLEGAKHAIVFNWFSGEGYPEQEAIIKSVESHEKNLNFGRILEASYFTSFLFNMVTSTCTLVTISIGVSTGDNAKYTILKHIYNDFFVVLPKILFNLHRSVFLLRFICVLNGFAYHIFFLTWLGQITMNISEAIFFAAYNNEWYECSVKSRKLLKRKTIKPFRLTAGGFFVMSFVNLDGIGILMIMKTALSYITVLASFM